MRAARVDRGVQAARADRGVQVQGSRGERRSCAARADRRGRAVRGCVVGGTWVVAVACHKDPSITTRAVTLHAPQNCAAGLSNLDSSAFGVYHALGDYEPAAPVDGHPLMVGMALPEIDPAARALLVVATEQDRAWQGVSALAPSGPVDVLLLPATTPCALRDALGDVTGSTIGIAGSQRVLVVGASASSAPGAATGSAPGAPGALVLRLDTGAIDTLPGTARSAATVTAFGAGALVAGGIAGAVSSRRVVVAEAAVYDAVRGSFDSQTIALRGPRAHAGATVLASGETLLVGGVGGDGVTPLDSMEIVDPTTRVARAAASTLAFARRDPTVLRLASGEVFVAGGVDANEAPVTMLEWFSSDGSHATKRPQDLVAGSARTYAALEAGGVLAVIAPPAGMASATFQNTWVIDPDGLPEAATPVEGALVAPVLFGGAGGAPVLWTGASASTSTSGGPGVTTGAAGRWLRWQPWAGAFVALGVPDDDTPGRILGASASPDPGAALWLDTTASEPATLAALRFDVRDDYATLSGPLLVSDATDTAPDRLSTDGMVSFGAIPGNPPVLGLTLEPGASAFVTDRTYADVKIQVDAPTGKPALIVLRDELGDELEVGSGACSGAIVTGKMWSLTLVRKGASITWAIANGASGTCALGFDANARVSVGVRGAPDLIQSVARNLRVTRLGEP